MHRREDDELLKKWTVVFIDNCAWFSARIIASCRNVHSQKR
jgi:hypothetical protein